VCLAAQVRDPAEMAELKAQLVEGVEVRARASGIPRAIARVSGAARALPDLHGRRGL
jgi:hypothetical protein